MARNRRPFVTVRKWEWHEGKTHTPGIGIMRGASVCAHLTPAEAIALADHLVDMAEALEPSPAPPREE